MDTRLSEPTRRPYMSIGGIAPYDPRLTPCETGRIRRRGMEGHWIRDYPNPPTALIEYRGQSPYDPG